MESSIILLVSFLVILILITKPLGLYFLPLAEGRAPSPLARLDGALMKLIMVNPKESQNWLSYTVSLLCFNVVGLFFLFLLLRFQGVLPLNSQGVPGMESYQAFNTAVSFITNTNWQSYAGETGVSYLSQMMGLAVQNFLAAASGICVAFVLMRAFAKKETHEVGNFFADLTRVTVYVLLPLAFIVALVFVSQGAIQNFGDAIHITTLAGSEQTIAMGPVASQESIKLLGTNGGGFFNANSAHPFENPNAFTNFLQSLCILALASGLTYTFGSLVKDTRQGWTIFAAMGIIFALCTIGIAHFESQATPALTASATHTKLVDTASVKGGTEAAPAQGRADDAAPAQGADAAAQTADAGKLSPTDSKLFDNQARAMGGYAMNMEGKEVRFDLAQTSLFTATTTAASNGAVNNMHDSLTPMAGLIPMLLMQLGEIIFGGVGAGFYGIIIFCLIAVFISGLMVGRTPEYLGKKITVEQMKLACLSMLVTPILVLVGTAITLMYPEALKSISNPSAHGFSQVLYAFSSAANNNGSAFAGLNANTPFFNLVLGIVMFLGRFLLIGCIMALSGSLITQKITPPSVGTLRTSGPLFVGLLIGTIIIVGALTYIPALALGPIAEHLALYQG